MTMPHLMNCQHSEDGWCLDCVKKLHDAAEELVQVSREVASGCYGFSDGVLKVDYSHIAALRSVLDDRGDDLPVAEIRHMQQ